MWPFTFLNESRAVLKEYLDAAALSPEEQAEFSESQLRQHRRFRRIVWGFAGFTLVSGVLFLVVSQLTENKRLAENPHAAQQHQQRELGEYIQVIPAVIACPFIVLLVGLVAGLPI